MAAETYIKQVLSWIPSAALRERIGLELKGLIAERVERGQSVEDAVRQLGDPEKLAESYVEAVPLHGAPHGRRLAAKLLDGLTVAIIAAAFGISLATLSEPPVRYFAPMLGILAFALGFPLVTVIAERRSGQTLGKWLFGLRAVRESGLRLTLGQSFLRQLPLFVQIFWIDAVFALFTERKQRAFELISKTRVITVNDEASGRESRVASTAFATLCVVILASPAALAQEVSAPPPPGRLVDVGGWRMHIHCTGEREAGAPIVILDAGSSDSSVEWSLVQPVVARFARVCSYDRSGTGWSELGPIPHNESPDCV